MRGLCTPICTLALAGVLEGCAPTPESRQADVSSIPSNISPRPKDKALTPLQKELDVLLKEAMTWRSLDKGTIIQRLEATADMMNTVSRQRLKGVLLIRNHAKHPANFYFRGEKQVLMTLGSPSLLDSYRDSDLFALLAGDPARLRSPYGKASTVYVYPELGISFTTRYEDPHRIQYIEIFEPQSLESYQHNLYEDPGTPDPGAIP